MRKVYLTPEHSSWWLLSPGVTLFFDQVFILRSDYDAIQTQGGNNYSDLAALHLERLITQATPVIEVIDVLPDNIHPETLDQETNNFLSTLFDSAQDSNDPRLEPKDIVLLLIDAYAYWIAFNQRKVKFIGEESELSKERIPAWQARQETIKALLKSPQNEILDRLKDQKQCFGTLYQLVRSALQCMRMVDAGLYIHDTLLVEYLPIIELLEGMRTLSAVDVSKGQNALTLLDIYRIRMERYGQVVPLDFSIAEIPKLFAEMTQIRKNLEQVDDALKAITAEDPDTAFDLVQKEISPLICETQRAAKLVENGFWVGGIISTLVSALARPEIVSNAQKFAKTISMIERNVGQFAGAYALVADEMIAAEREFSRVRRYGVDYTTFKKTFWDSGK